MAGFGKRSIVLLLPLLCSLFGVFVAAQDDPVVELDYGTFQGRYNAQYNISYFRKIPFGASTAGENRFRAPQPPPTITNGTYNTDQSFDMCPQRTVNGSEDCLYLGLYSRPWTADSPLRPVLVVFYGGGFIQGSASFSIPPPMYPVLNATSANDFVVVYPNYRTNAFGFLPGRAVKDSPTADLNAGLLDQRAALRWVQANIAAFGGDPTAVTIQGQSAGGGSVIAQAIAAHDSDEKLFSRALPGSPFWPKTYAYDAPEAEALYAELVERVGCADQADPLACLKAADAQAIRDASLAISALNTYTTSSFNWGPVIDGDFLRTPLSAVDSLNADAVAWSTFNTHEGENFVPGGLGQPSGSNGFNNSEAGFDFWLRGYLPRFSDAQIAEAKRLYPAQGDAEEAAWNTTTVRAGMVFRDSVLACPGLWLAEAAAGEKKGYLSEYTISPAKHGSDTQFWNQVNAVQKSQPVTYNGLAGAMASFFQTGDPNAHKLTDDSQAAVPELDEGKEWVVKTETFETTDIDRLKTRCAFWRENAQDIPL
ncbi:putative carboxylesterase protein [Lasiodiplodia theobromae]|uniref:Carboxylic ester hydrolase n=1 Tax=Lasiodiplodia theobromae TaxID=45133 RepID=A0A5N5D0L1_9PEZI|nr:Acetylcholinesterase [Lasiodiplodia theobromae]KAF9638747.1 putative carboxylesterase protein [Lasiodiplodia theobromae]